MTIKHIKVCLNSQLANNSKINYQWNKISRYQTSSNLGGLVSVSSKRPFYLPDKELKMHHYNVVENLSVDV